MAGSGSLTFTGNIGPGQAVTSLVFNNVTAFNFNLVGQSLEIVQGSNREYVDLSGRTTCTWTISGSTYTVTIS